MPKKKGATKVTLKSAKKAIQKTPEGYRRLTLSNMGLTSFPKCLLKLKNLQELDLSRNQIQELPDNFGNLVSLKWLDLHTNKLESVPESISKLVRLTHLNLSNNHLTSAGLPSTLGSLIFLKSLNLGMNKLDSLPPSMEALDSLRELGLFDNFFTELPGFVKNNQYLTKVNVKRNPCSIREREGMLTEKKKPEEDCQEQKGGGKEGKGGHESGVDTLEKKGMRTFSGLMTPNSVATVSQHMWRLKENVECKQIK